MQIMITGGAGFIGSHIADLLIEDGHTVVVVDNLSTGRRENLPPAAAFVELDITDPALEALFQQKPFDAVCHQAAQPSVPRSLAEPLFDGRVNILGTLHLLECCRRYGVGRFVFASSAAVYGNPLQIPIREDAPPRPLSPYGLAKLTAEGYLRLYHNLFGVEAIALRYANVYGPRQDAHGEAGVVAIFADKMLAGEQPVIDGDGEQTRDFVFVTDVARANLAALAHDVPAGVYNVGSGIATSINRLFDLLSASRFPRRHGPARPGDIHHSLLDSAALHAACDWRPTVPLAEGLAHTWAHLEARFA